MNHYYFAYGSNLSETQMYNRCPNSKLFKKAVLKGYKLYFTIYSPKWGGGCADVIKENGEEVWGLVYKISSEDLARLDSFEGHPIHYRRFHTYVFDKKKKIGVEVYEVVDKKPFIKPTKEYLDIIKNACRKFSFPKHYVQYIESIPYERLQLK